MSDDELTQVGWYCDHHDEPAGKRTHMSNHGKSTRKGWIETYPDPSVSRAMTLTNHNDPAKPPHCPRAVPVYIKKETKP